MIASHEKYRKYIHLTSLIYPLMYTLWLDQQSMLFLMIGLSMIIWGTEILRRISPYCAKFYLKFFQASLRPSEYQGITGASYFLLGATITIACFSREISILALVILVISDTLAALVGQRFGRFKLLHKKTLEGTFAFFMSALIIISFGHLFFLLPWWPLALAAFAATVLELCQDWLKLDDNILIPIGFAAFSTILL